MSSTMANAQAQTVDTRIGSETTVLPGHALLRSGKAAVRQDLEAAGPREAQLKVARLLWAHVQGLKLVSSRTKSAKLINGRSNWREFECLKRFCQHLFQINLGANTNGDVRIEFRAGRDSRKIGYIFDQGLLDVAALLGTHERCGSPRFLRVGRNRLE